MIAAVGCGSVPSQTTLDTHNQRSYDDAVARAEQGFGGETFTPVRYTMWPGGDAAAAESGDATAESPAPPAAVADRVRGQGDGDQLYRMPGGNLGMASQGCLVGSACGCDVSLSYLYLRRADGHVAVVRLRPTIKTYRKKVEACGYGCGVPAPPEATVIADLGVTDPALVEVIEAPFRREEVVEYCDHPTPRP